MNVRIRALLWALLLLLTAIILAYPVRLVCKYSAIQAPNLFGSLPLFSVLFCVWMLVMLLLAVSKTQNSRGPDLENLVLVCVFGLVFWGFWVVITPYGSYADDIWNQGHVRWLVQEGTIPIGHKNLTYFDYPGMHLLLSAISELSGLGVAGSRTVFLVANALIFSALLYMVLERVLGNPGMALLGVLLIAMVSIPLVDKMRIFGPASFGLTLLAGVLLVMTKWEARPFGSGVPDRLVMLLLFGAMVISYFANSFLVLLILVGILLVHRLARDDSRGPNAATIVALAVLVLGWAVYWTWHTFDTLTGFLPKVKEQILSGGFMETAVRLRTSNIGGSLPAWASVTRLGGWALLAASTILGLSGFWRIKSLTHGGRMVTGALLGVVLLFLVGVFGTRGGYQFSRLLLYAPLFAIPAALLIATNGGALRRMVFLLGCIVAFVLALPAFLSSVNTVSTDAIYRSDTAGGAFLEGHSEDKGADLVVYSVSIDSASLASCYVPNTTIKRLSLDVLYTGNQDEVWDELADLVAAYANRGAGTASQHLFMTNEKSRIECHHLLGIPLDDPNWQATMEALSGTNVVYDNGHMQVFAS